MEHIMSIKNKLNRMKGHLSTSGKKEGETSAQKFEKVPKVGKEISFQDTWASLNVRPYFYEESYSFIREVSYPLDYKHGRYSLATVKEMKEEWAASAKDHPLSCAEQPISDILFFDTETTGLSGGAGTYIFLLGYARILEDRVEVKQHILPNPSAEVPFYHAFLTDVEKSLHLLTSYNGKAFDWPQVKSRHTFVRERVPTLPSFGHYDLLHAARRLWKNILPSCKLSIVEKEILHFERKEDTPGYLAPMLYFDFLQEQDPLYLKGIIEHNEWDVLSLITLYTHLSKLLLTVDKQRLSVNERYEIGRWFEQLGNREEAINYLETVVNEQTFHQEAAVLLSKCYKKRNEIEKAVAILEKACEGNIPPLEGFIELSMLYEHQLKIPQKALAYAELGLQIYEKRKHLSKKRNEKWEKDLHHRIRRLRNK